MNKSIEHSHTPQETATDCSYVGLQAIMSTVRLFANKYINCMLKLWNPLLLYILKSFQKVDMGLDFRLEFWIRVRIDV